MATAAWVAWAAWKVWICNAPGMASSPRRRGTIPREKGRSGAPFLLYYTRRDIIRSQQTAPDFRGASPRPSSSVGRAAD